ncbi:hypothetical protein [Streptomyces sp. NPDC054952]
MTYRRAAIPALAGGLLLAALLWWAGASTAALHLPGSSRVLGIGTAVELEHWLAPWSYDPPGADGAGDGGGYAAGASDSARYLSLYATAVQIRFGAVFAFFVPGALLLVRRLPPLRGRVSAALLAVWAWGLVAGTLAMAVSAPWLIAGQGHGSYRFLPQIASVISSGAQVLVVAALLAATVTVLLARVTTKGAGPLPQAVVPARAARLAATVGTSLIATSLVILSYQPVAAAIQEASTGSGLLSEPGDLLRLWLLLGGWAGPQGGSIGSWILYRLPDVVLLAVVWGALRRLPGLLTRVTLPAVAVGTVCATVLGLLASQLLQVLMEVVDSGARWGVPRLFAGLGTGVPAALTWGLVAGVAAAVTLRVVTARTARAEGT